MKTLHVLELANLQLEELIAYDRLLDGALERAYADLLRPPKHLSRNVLMNRLREVRIDLARFSDELSNITKFFGDWHLARLYDAVSRRFHLGDWHRTIDDKLKTLDELYEMLKQEQNHRLMVVLEAAIVLMFLIDIIALFGGFGSEGGALTMTHEHQRDSRSLGCRFVCSSVRFVRFVGNFRAPTRP